MTNKRYSDKTFRLVMTALLFAIVIVLQSFGGAVPIGSTSFSFVLVPIVVGAITLGPAVGAFLGASFGIVAIINGLSGADPFTHLLLIEEPIFTVIICILKGLLAGWCSGLIWKALMKKNEIAAVFIAAAATPIINTLVFFVGGLLFFGDALATDPIISGYTAGTSLFNYFFYGIVLINFPPELLVNIIFAPAISRIIKAFKKV